MKNFFSWLGKIGLLLGVVAVFLGLKQDKSTDEKIKQIESEAKKDVEKMSDAAVITFLNHTLASRRNKKG